IVGTIAAAAMTVTHVASGRLNDYILKLEEPNGILLHFKAPLFSIIQEGYAVPKSSLVGTGTSNNEGLLDRNGVDEMLNEKYAVQYASETLFSKDLYNAASNPDSAVGFKLMESPEININERNDWPVASTLLRSSNVNVNLKNSDTPLNLAYFIDQGADINTRNGHLNIVKYLVEEEDLSVDGSKYGIDMTIRTALDIATDLK
uniref:Alpha-latrotoxin-Lm1a (Fragments) n=1 Tax=Latrodectus mactans TaxID=6924 RepID=LATA_LATMA|nr:RecName: Full=Alpha-latrotoxin-Lm1a; Short=Alpha-LTX-Lm1a; AltName: Full=Alpha-latrotoxin; Short=Alpha-LTX [Latrodectus mactans]